jgi:hypothetical protein
MNIIVINNTKNLDIFFNDCRRLYEISLTEKHPVHCGIDFEYNMNWRNKERYISLMQIIMIDDIDKYHSDGYIKTIYILDPLRLPQNKFKMLVKYIFCSKIIKILHGSDSLDYPHIYKSILYNNKKNFMQFINSSVDTRFLCEISKRIMCRTGILEIPNNKCSIYNALLDHGIIDKNLFDELEKIASHINYNKDWIITKLKPEQIHYSAYDVVYLYDLLETIKNSMVSDINILSIVNRLYRFHMLNKLGLIDITKKCKKIMDSYKITKDDMMIIDSKIMEKHITNLVYSYQNVKHNVNIVMEDILSIDTIRKSILYCLRIYQINNPSDIIKVDSIFNETKLFKMLLNNKTITNLIDIIRHK